ncbi:MAG: hypothetical protein ACK4K7_04840 [Allosphingosinicella sp.]|uniref:hypothetical protein n=1 Tax=Allosphingosinicella sp. TaxID=2823234 RepID=UPI00393FEFDD
MRIFGRFAAAAALALVAAMPAAAQTEAEQAQIAAAVERGRLLYALDRAAALATRDMFGRIENPEDAGIDGFVIVPEGQDLAIIFYGAGADGPEAIYRGIFRGGRIAEATVHPEGERPALSAVQRRMAAARAAAGRANRQSCAQDAPFNVTVIPPEADDAPLEVYLFTPQTQRGRFPAGGHHRVVYTGDAVPAEERAFASGCQLLSAEGAVAGIETEALYLTHPLDPVPTEVHMFLSLWTGKPLIVGAGGRSWRVDRDGIRLEADGQ